MAQQPKSSLRHPTFEVSRSHTHTHTHTHTQTHSVELVWTNAQFVQKPLPTKRITKKKRITNTRDEHPCPQRDCYPRSQESSGRGHTSETARPSESAIGYRRPISNYEVVTFIWRYFILLFLFTFKENVLNTTKLNWKYSFPDPGSFYPVYSHHFVRIIIKSSPIRFKLKLTAVSRHINIQQGE